MRVLILFSLLFSTLTFSQIEKDKEIINKQLDEWHLAATNADEDGFFGPFFNSGIYIGTDATELWTAAELKEWSKKFFERDSAWDFKRISRNIYFSEKESVAWFNELLDTWMGVCRASGVLEKENGKWLLKHYHLSITVPNEIVNDYLKLIGKE